MDSSGCHVLEEAFDVLVVNVVGGDGDVGDVGLMGRATVSTRVAPTVLGRQLRSGASTWTMCWVLG